MSQRTSSKGDAQAPSSGSFTVDTFPFRPVNVEDPESSSGRPETDSSLTWEDVKWLVSITDLPVIAKGILRQDDALKAIESGCKAVWVSNHGGRLVDTAPATVSNGLDSIRLSLFNFPHLQIDVLPGIADAVNKRVPIILDSGIRMGTDVLKALALSADMVFMGRPILWGLAVDGERGVERVLNIVSDELQNSMALCGLSTINDLSRDVVQPKEDKVSRWSNVAEKTLSSRKQ